MGAYIWEIEYRRMVQEAVKQIDRKLLPEPTQREIVNALLDHTDQWSPEARHWMGLD